MTSQQLAPPPYQSIVTPAANNSNTPADLLVNKELKKALDDFKEFKQAMGLCIAHAVTCMLCYTLLLVFAPLQEMARDLFGIDDMCFWTLTLATIVLSLPCLMTIYGVLNNRPGWLIPFVEIQLGGGFLLFCGFVSWFIDGYVNRPAWWVRANTDGYTDTWLLCIFVFYTILFLYLNATVQFCFWIALRGMIKYPAKIHQMALNNFGRGSADLLVNPMLSAELQLWQKRMNN